MKIAISINTSWNIYNFRSGLIRYLQRLGHEVIAIAPKDDYTDRLIKELGCDYRAVVMENKGTNPISDYQLYRQYRRLFTELAPDVVLQYTIKPNIYGALAAHAVGIPVINNVSGLGTIFINRNSLASVVGRWLYRKAFRFPAKVFFQNEADRSLFVDEQLVVKAKTAVLPGSGVDLHRFGYSPKIASEKTVFLMVARVLYDKGVMEYGRACMAVRSKFPQVECRLIGFHDQSAGSVSAQDFASVTGENGIRFLGSSDDVYSHMTAADAIVLPSYREGTSKTLLEALAVGRPLLTTDVPGCRETVVSGENGWLCEARNADDLARIMEEFVLTNAEKRMEMGKNSRALAEAVFDEQKVFEAYKRAIDEL